MTTVYYVRHAKPNFQNHDDHLRELTEQGMADRVLVTEYLRDKKIDAVLSSPYKRAVDTVAHFAGEMGLSIELVDGFRERRVDSVWIEDFDGFVQRQWADFTHKQGDGESLAEVRARNIAALVKALRRYPDHRIVIGGHGTALSTILNHYNPTFGHAAFLEMKGKMPWIVKLTFQGLECVETEPIDLL